MDRPVPDELISAFFDGEVSPEERLEVERLLETSHEFRQQLDDTSKLSALLHSFPREAAPADLVDNVRQQVENAVLSPSPVTPSTVVPVARRSLRREWTAFGGGILATVVPLVLFVVLNAGSDHLPMNPDPMYPSTESKQFKAPAAVQLAEQEKLMQQADALEVAGTFDAPQAMPAMKRLAPRDEMPVEGYSLSRATKSEKPSAKDAATAPQAAEMAVTAAPAAIAAEAGLEFADVGMNQVHLNTGFLWNLSNGDVVVPKIADPDNTVAVVDFVVVDMVRDMNELMLLLQKRAVRPLEEQSNADQGNRDATKQNYEFKEEAKKKTSQSDEMQLIYVKAPGDQLAGAIEEFSRNHPDLNWSPQLPIELPSNPAIKDSENALAERLNLAQNKSDTKEDSLEDPEMVNMEADLAFDALIARNNSVTNTDGLGGALPQENATPLADSAGPRTDRRRLAGSPPTPVTAPAQADVKSANGVAVATAQVQQNGQGYFRVAVQNQAQSRQGVSPLSAAQNSPVPAIGNGTQMGNAFGSSNTPRYALGNSNYDGRGSRPVKMLIVLKSQQPAASNHVP